MFIYIHAYMHAHHTCEFFQPKKGGHTRNCDYDKRRRCCVHLRMVALGQHARMCIRMSLDTRKLVCVCLGQVLNVYM